MRVTLVPSFADPIPGWPSTAVRRAGVGARRGQRLAGILQTNTVAHQEQT